MITLIPLACVAMTCLGLLLGTTFEPRNIGLMFGFVVLPLTFLGGTYYQWQRLAPVKVGGFPWLQTLVLVNPLIYITEGMRAGLTEASHMPLYVIYPVLIGSACSSGARDPQLQASRAALRTPSQPISHRKGVRPNVRTASIKDRQRGTVR